MASGQRRLGVGGAGPKGESGQMVRSGPVRPRGPRLWPLGPGSKYLKPRTRVHNFMGTKNMNLYTPVGEQTPNFKVREEIRVSKGTRNQRSLPGTNL